MAIRKSEDRRVGGDPEKLLTLEETAKRLDIPPDDVEAMIRSGKLPAFHLAGSLLRIRLKDVEVVKSALSHVPDAPSSGFHRQVSKSRPLDRLWDFLYFNDFYLISILIILTLLAVILIL